MKILLIQLRRLGDLILTTPAISALREHLPGAQIALAVSGECAPLLPAIHGLQETFLTKRGLRDLSAWMEISRAGFDCVVDFTRNDRSAWVTFLSGGRDELERAHLAAVRQHLHTPVLDLSGQLDLLSLAALIERARLLVTVDSAPMHLASATGTPQVILFGPTNPFHWRPRKSPAAILFGESPEPLRHFQAREAERPMRQISTTAVIDAMRLMVSAPAASAV